MEIFDIQQQKLIRVLLENDVVLKGEDVVEHGLLKEQAVVISFTFDEFRDYCLTNYILRNSKDEKIFFGFWDMMVDETQTVLEGVEKYAFSMTGEEPFWNRRGPELLDISITNYCERNCDFCYRETSSNGTFMPLEQYTKIIAQAETAGVLQVALGGGNPNQHPDFVSILEVTRKHHIIPSYTTNGQGMTDEIYNATKCYCGAMAVSWYEPYSEATQVIKNCQETLSLFMIITICFPR